MNVHQSQVLEAPTNNELTNILVNIPNNLQWNKKDNGREINYNKVFGLYTELPPELKNKILSYQPRVNISKSELDISTENFNDYCLNEPITIKDLKLYLLSNNDDKTITVFRIYYFRGQYMSSVNTCKISWDNNYIITKLGMHYREEILGSEETIDKVLPYIGLAQHNYVVLFDELTTNNIVNMRLSCKQNNYAIMYKKYLNTTFVNYFRRFPIIIYKYSQLLSSALPGKYILYIKEFENKANKIYGKSSIFYQTDEESQKILQLYYNTIFL
jgi:hypothetical protein